jgi:HK97 gp10 family phage protein
MIQIVNMTGKFMRELSQKMEAAKHNVGRFCVEKMRYYVAVDTGYLQSRCEYVVVRNELFLQNDAPYALFQEKGTSKMNAHPFMYPAVYNHKSEIELIVFQTLRM